MARLTVLTDRLIFSGNGTDCRITSFFRVLHGHIGAWPQCVSYQLITTVDEHSITDRQLIFFAQILKTACSVRHNEEQIWRQIRAWGCMRSQRRQLSDLLQIRQPGWTNVEAVWIWRKRTIASTHFQHFSAKSAIFPIYSKFSYISTTTSSIPTLTWISLFNSFL